MFSRGRPATFRTACLLLGALCASRAILDATATSRHPGDLDFDTLLVALASWLLVLCSAWAVLLCGAVTCEAWSAGRVRALTWLGCPPAVRRILLSVVGLALAGGVPGAASAADPPGTDHGRPQTASSLPVPARPLGTVTRARPPTHVVHAGDTLWGIARARLDGAAGSPEVASLVERLHQVNRDLIGPDPDRIEPGQRLVIPNRNAEELESP